MPRLDAARSGKIPSENFTMLKTGRASALLRGQGANSVVLNAPSGGILLRRIIGHFSVRAFLAGSCRVLASAHYKKSFAVRAHSGLEAATNRSLCASLSRGT